MSTIQDPTGAALTRGIAEAIKSPESQNELRSDQDRRWSLRGPSPGHERGSRLTEDQIAHDLEEFDHSPVALTLLQLVPLVQVAWAEGRVTRRERELIMELASLRGIASDSPAFAKLEGWLEFRPTEEFFEQSLRLIARMIQRLPEEDRHEARGDLVSYCIQIADISGGSIGFVSGGAKICAEEIEIIKRIAVELNRNVVEPPVFDALTAILRGQLVSRPNSTIEGPAKMIDG